MRYAVLLVLKILLAIIGIMLLLLLLPVHLRATFNGDLKVSAGVLFINFKLYPRPPVSEKKRLKKERREQKRKKKRESGFPKQKRNCRARAYGRWLNIILKWEN